MLVYLGLMGMICYPLLFIWFAFGRAWALVWSAAILLFTTIAAFTTAVGAVAAFIFGKHALFQSWVAPKSYLNTYLYNLWADDSPLYHVFAAPYIAYFDVVRYSFSLAIHLNSVWMWGFMVFGYYLIWKIIRLYHLARV